MAVMVWIHGGGYTLGEGAVYDGSNLAVKGDWVKSNIETFCGNPSAITIFGESAGGMSVSYHTLILYNKGLFQRAFAQSGTAFSSPVITA
ncbi:hypothetical protein KUTeg_011898 [Tegillarca granosa]|uniref:Carboxylesterase type B domain-containing protein n=1 Tax=Tegillarca granosa TaxID=220873 RepID=A0ABQ9F389_TEGGR|nr:hypothetical protein KUTeg_011898 [Tegillarca granosa]